MKERAAIRGVIFDMDGVLVDSERLYLRFWREASAALGFSMSEEQALSLRSNSPEAAIPKFRAWFGEGADYYAIRELRRERMARYIDAHGVALKEGAADTLAALKTKGYRIALATSSPARRAAKYLPPALFDAFDAVVSGTDVARSKPAPDIYLRVAEALSLRPEQCMAVEDSPTGVEAARAAGCFTVMVPDMTQPDEATRAKCGCVLTRLPELLTLLA